MQTVVDRSSFINRLLYVAVEKIKKNKKRKGKKKEGEKILSYLFIYLYDAFFVFSFLSNAE